jgi:hypothetical protein
VTTAVIPDDKGISSVPDSSQASDPVVIVSVPGLGDVQVIVDGARGENSNRQHRDG